MKKDDEMQQTDLAHELDAVSTTLPFEPISIRTTKVSGLYALAQSRAGYEQTMEETDLEASLDPLPYPILAQREELRVDVDGYYPQMTASGSLQLNLAHNIHWIARLKRTGNLTYKGGIWYKNGATMSFPYTETSIISWEMS